MDNDYQLALLSALDKRIKPRLEEAKAQAKYALMEQNQTDGTDRRAIRINDVKVGEVGISYSKAKPICKPGREKAFEDWLLDNGLATVSPIKGWENAVAHAGNAVLDKTSGEILDFLDWQASLPLSAAVRGCKPEDVLEAIGSLPAQDVIKLLGGSDE